MAVRNSKLTRRTKIRFRTRKRISGTFEIPRLSIYKSNQYIYTQLIDDMEGKTLAFASSKALGEKNVTIEKAQKVGMKLAELALEKGINRIVFDRSGYTYHGRVKAVAEAVREAGIQF